MHKRLFSLALACLLSACGGEAGPLRPAEPPTNAPAASAADNVHARMEAFRHLDPANDPDAPENDETVWRVPAVGAPTRGNPAAPVTIVEFGDFQCAFCVRAAATLGQVRSTYGDRVRFVWRDLPLAFHGRALAAAEFAREARAEKGDAGFWAAHDALILAHGALDDGDLDDIARRLSVDPAAARAAVAASRYADGIDDDLEFAEDVGAEGTPTFFVNGRRIAGAQPFDVFKAVIDAELARAAAGARTMTYEDRIGGGQRASMPRRVQIAVPTSAPARGSAGARVTIQEFADFECPYCARAEESLRRALSSFPNDVRLVWRHLPLSMHPDAELAAEAAAEAKKQKGDPGFWAMHDKLLASEALPHGLERPALITYAKELGLDVRAFEKALDARAHAAEVTMDAKAAAAADIHGTPAFVVDGYVLDGAQPFVRLRKFIRGAMAAPAGSPPSPR